MAFERILKYNKPANPNEWFFLCKKYFGLWMLQRISRKDIARCLLLFPSRGGDCCLIASDARGNSL